MCLGECASSATRWQLCHPALVFPPTLTFKGVPGKVQQDGAGTEACRQQEFLTVEVLADDMKKKGS